MIWIPESARRQPAAAMVFVYRVAPSALPMDAEDRIRNAVRAAGLESAPGAGPAWIVSFPHSTRVYGIVGREVDEKIELRLSTSDSGHAVVLECRPDESHAAHAAGLAGVLVLAATLWLMGGLFAGVLPAVTAVLAGWLVVEVTRQWAMDALERRLRSLLDLVGMSVWPGVPAEIQQKFTEIES
ncbi:MAG: hypothetical protein PVG92_00800 [Holophagae bacterium]